MQANPDQLNIADYPLQLLLFIDKRPSSREQVRQVGTALKELREECEFELQIIDVSEQPYLAEYFRLIATPALIKIHPEPRQTLAGSTLVQQLQHWWIHWQRSVVEYSASTLASAAGSGAMEVRSLKQTLALEIAAVTPQTGDSMGAPFSNAPIANLESPILSEAEQSTLRSLKDSFDSSASFNLVMRSTELIRLSDEVFRLKREKEDLEHQLQFKDQILAMLAHDLRNPLTATSIALETLERDCNPQDGIESILTLQLKTRLLNHARTQTRAIDRMITDVLQAARGIGSDARIHPHKLDLGALCVDVLNDLQDRFQEKSQQVETDIPSDLPMILADGERIRQVLINLLDNAVKYTPPGGTIQLAALHRTTQKVQISVGDNGPGIPPENQERIFEERFRLQRDEDKEGYGIGLSLCQRIVRAHYGQIWVDSTSNQGSCFHFTLPVFRK